MSIALLLIGLFGVSSPLTVGPAAQPDVVFVQGGATPHLLLERRPGAECGGAPAGFVAHRHAVQCPAQISPSFAAQWIGRTVRLHGGKGECTAEVLDLHLLSWFDPGFDYKGQWFDEVPATTQDAALLKAALAQATQEDRFLAAALKVADPAACEGARWAQPIDAEPARVQPLQRVAPALAADALRRFRAHEGHQAMQRRYRAEADGAAKGIWDSFDGAHPQVRVFKSAAATYVYAGASVGGCGYFDADFWVIWRKNGTRWTVVTDADQVGEFIAPALMIEGKGGPLFVDHTVLIAPQGPLYEVVEDVDVHSFICPC